MPRQLKRYQDHGNHHFVTFRCYRRLPYLDNDRARTVFEEQLEGLRLRHPFYVFGYVLMPEHVQMLVSEPKCYKLSTSLNVLKAEVSKQCKDGRKQFWQRRYHDFNVLTHRKHVEAALHAPQPRQARSGGCTAGLAVVELLPLPYGQGGRA